MRATSGIDDGGQLPERGHSDLDAGGDRRREIGVRPVQPTQNRRSDARVSERECLGDGGDPELECTRSQSRVRDVDRAVVVPVCLHHGHRRGVPRVLAENANVVVDGGEIDDDRAAAPGLGEPVGLGDGVGTTRCTDPSILHKCR